MKNIVSVAALIVACLPVAQAATITQWNFENDAIAANNSPAPSSGTGTASSIGMDIYPTPNIGVTADDVLDGVAADTGVNGPPIPARSGVFGPRLAQTGRPMAGRAWRRSGLRERSSPASTVGYNSVNVAFDWYATNQGEANLMLEYSTNGGASWNNVPITIPGADADLAALTNSTSPNTVTGSYVQITGATGQGWFPDLTATITDPNAANDANFEIELVNASTGADDISAKGTALNNNSGNWRFDNVTISGTAVTATPEPASFALFGLGLIALVAGSRKFGRAPRD